MDTLHLAGRMAVLKASEIREILKVTEQEGVVSFAGGLPAPELFPVGEIAAVTRIVLDEQGTKALQYTTTEGYAPLREWIAGRMNRNLGTSFDRDDILITHGSQQALDLSGKVFLDEGDVVLCESPTYLAAINAFKSYGCRFVEIPTDERGMDPEVLEATLRRTPRVKLVYVIPTFQNPTGRCWDGERRRQLAEISARYRVAVIEDNPYEELRFEGEAQPSVAAFDRTGNVLCCGTFSKIFCPGFRIGWIAGRRDLIRKYVLVKQGADLQCNTFAQMVIAAYLERYDIDDHVRKIRTLYKHRRDLALRTIERSFPAEVCCTRPGGGLFAWMELPARLSARDLLTKSLEQRIAFVPGGSFFPNAPRENTLRLNYSNMPDDRIEAGLERLGALVGDLL